MSVNQSPYTITPLINAYLTGELDPEQVVHDVCQIASQHKVYNIWIHLEEKERVLQEVADRKAKLKAGKALPLFCVPFAVKDNIDVAGLPTTAGCPGYAYVAEKTAETVQKLLDAGAILIGKTNMDQFATGLVGVRSPYGAVKNAFLPEYISGGSSSGSAVAVALGMVCFSLGTDTAGSGRIPAGFNNLVGLKPTIGRISTAGVVPACKSLDCVSVFSHTLEDAALVYDVCTGHQHSVNTGKEEKRALRIGIPHQHQLFFEEASGYGALFRQAKKQIAAKFSAKSVSFDAFSDTANLLYQGPWVAERMAAIKPFYEESADKITPVVRGIIENAGKYSATDTFEAFYKLDELRKKAREVFEEIDLLVVPTAPGIYTIEEVEQRPVELNTRLGYYTNYVNLLGLCAIAIPAGFNQGGLPFGITLVAPEGKDKQLLEWAKRIAEQLMKAEKSPAGTPGYVELAVAGLHKRNQPLVHQLTDLMAEYSYTTTTSPDYRMYLVDPDTKMKPGLVKVEKGQEGYAIEVEIWQIPTRNLGAFMTMVPHPLGIGKVELADGSFVQGFICEQYIAAFSEDISQHLSWENFLVALSEKKNKVILN